MKLGNASFSNLCRLCLVAIVFSIGIFAHAELKISTTRRMGPAQSTDQSAGASNQATSNPNYYNDPNGGFQSDIATIIEGAGDANTCFKGCSVNLTDAKELSICQSACTSRYGAAATQDSQATGASPCADLESLKSACANQYTSTASSCDANKDSGMSNVSKTASQLSLAFGQQSAASIQAACSGVGQISAAANAALAAYRLTCSNSMNKCSSTCSAVVDYLKANPACDSQGSETSSAQAEVKKCSQFDAKINEANQAIVNVGQTLNNASQCASLTSSGVSDLCKTNPSLPGCSTAAMDCSNPAMASNKVCICTKNPADPSCNSTITGMSGSSTSFSSSDPSARLANKSATSAGGGDIPGLDPIAQGKPGSTDYSSGAVSGKQGGGASLSGSNSGSSGGGGLRGGGGYGSGDVSGHSVNAGFYGGSGSGSGFSSGGGYTGGRGYAGSGGLTVGQNGVPNLRQFLPGGQNDPRLRGIAGASGPDGITGPHSNIWQKVNNRYRTMVPTLLP
ncbi:MAG: hypothetical protein ACM3MG_01180 [Bacillota bacterium]